MADLPLTIGSLRYDHMRALRDGDVHVAGVDATYETADIVSEIFENMIRHATYDVSELGLTFYLRLLDQGDDRFVAIPVFPNRHFRHNAIYVNTAGGIRTPRDLVGRTVGEFATYGHDVGVWVKGILADDFGVTPDQVRWMVGGADFPMKPYDFVPFVRPDGVEVIEAPDGKGLAPMLEAGEIDAFVSAIAPQAYLQGSPKIAQLFPDAEATERDYYLRTGILPIMHTVVVRRDLLERHPGLARALYRGFSDSKDAMLTQLRRGVLEQHVEISVPWFTPLYIRNRRLLPDDFWPYGVRDNRHALDTYLRYFQEQGLSKRRWTCEEIFAPELLDT